MTSSAAQLIERHQRNSPGGRYLILLAEIPHSKTEYRHGVHVTKATLRTNLYGVASAARARPVGARAV
jgi:hypothetical protein